MSLGGKIPSDFLISHAEEIDEIFRQAVREALLRSKKLGHSVSAWRDGRVVTIPPEEIPVDDEPPGKL